jgi:hypothetical protein
MPDNSWRDAWARLEADERICSPRFSTALIRAGASVAAVWLTHEVLTHEVLPHFLET